MNREVNAIANRLSLRSPQRTSLEILDRVCDVMSLQKNGDSNAALAAIKVEYPSVTDFERDFPSLCFALATGVGKTRLMGAFIAYLYCVRNIRHFFVLAPNLTIYNKLIGDFMPNTPKYVLQGISEFAVDPPVIITGDNYESGRGVRTNKTAPLFGDEDVHINIFNISKINSEVRGGRSPRIKRLSEYIGQSYFEYLSGIDDLVMLMDESHRYRGSAGISAINELRPVLGLELTATPQIERGTVSEHFKNVIYAYPLSDAMADGFVKEPAVATRQNFNPKNYDDGGLEKLKLEDGLRIHEETKVQLEVYARQNDKPIVKPFVLVIARDTTHANALLQLIEDSSFFNGAYKGKVITVHSNQTGQEKDETVEQLINVEKPGNPTEIVIHVNMLKEGWDVTNLYTIIPLRTANSKTLVEQSIGRGLRLPYGKRTGVPDVDRLTIVSHDRFQEIVDYANSPDSIIRGGFKVIHIGDERSRPVTVEPIIFSHIRAGSAAQGLGTAPLFSKPKEQEVAELTMQIIQREYERLPRSADLAKPEILKEIEEKVRAVVIPAQTEIEGTFETIDYATVIQDTVKLREQLTIDVPRITVQPVGDVTRGYRKFKLDLSNVHYQPVTSEILVQELHSRAQHTQFSGTGVVPEQRLEDYLVRGLVDFDDVNYDEHSQLLYDLAAQVVSHLKGYLVKDSDVQNVLQYNQKDLVSLVHSQMQGHFEEKAVAYEAFASKGFVTPHAASYSAKEGEAERDFRAPVSDPLAIKKMLFGGFKKCLYPLQKFDSDSERRFACLLENDSIVLKWFRPTDKDIRINWSHERNYEPDFIVETKDAKYLCEIKRESETEAEEAHEKAKAAAEWCRSATLHACEHNDKKPWHYLLIPHNMVQDNKTLQGLAAQYQLRDEARIYNTNAARCRINL